MQPPIMQHTPTVEPHPPPSHYTILSLFLPQPFFISTERKGKDMAGGGEEKVEGRKQLIEIHVFVLPSHKIL